MAHLDVLTLEIRNFVGVLSFLVDRTGRHLLLSDNTLPDRDSMIVLSERGRLVNDSSSRIRGDIRIGDDSESSFGELHAITLARGSMQRSMN